MTAIMMLTVVGCDKGKDDGKLKIGVTMQGNQSSFIQYITTGIYEYEKKHKDEVSVEVVFADDDAAKQLSQIETFVSKGVDAIIVNPVDKTQGATGVDLAADNDIPVITVNTTTDSKKNTAHVGSDDILAGKMQMQEVIDKNGKNINVAYVDAVLGHSAQIGRAKGYEEALKANPGVKLAVHDTGNWSPDESMKLVENWIQKGMKMDAILCMADCQLNGVITAIENAGKIGKIKLAGMDCDPTILKAIKDGKVECSIWQDGNGQGENALRLAIAAAKGEKVEDMMIPYEVCNGDNIDDYMQKAKVRDELAKKYF